MYIHKLGKTTSGFGSRMTRRGAGIRSSGASNHKRTLTNGVREEVYTEGGTISSSTKSTDLLRNLRLSKPRVAKKYISLL
jgi:hypothetical protein